MTSSIVCSQCALPLQPNENFCGECGGKPKALLETAENIQLYEENLRDFASDGVIEDWEDEELLRLRNELQIGQATHERLVQQYKPLATTLPLGFDIDQATFTGFVIDRSGLLRARLRNDGDRPLRHVAIHYITSGDTSLRHHEARVIGPKRDDCFQCSLRFSQAGHYSLEAVLKAEDTRGREQYYRAVPAGFLVGESTNEGPTSVTYNIDNSKSAAITEFDLNGTSSRDGGAIQSASWRAVQLKPISAEDWELWLVQHDPARQDATNNPTKATKTAQSTSPASSTNDNGPYATEASRSTEAIPDTQSTPSDSASHDPTREPHGSLAKEAAYGSATVSTEPTSQRATSASPERELIQPSAPSPESMLAQVLYDMGAQLGQAKKHLAVALADKERLGKKAQDALKSASQLQLQAMRAVGTGNNALSSESLRKAQEHQQRAESLTLECAKQNERIEALQGPIRVLEEKIKQAQSKWNENEETQETGPDTGRLGAEAAGLPPGMCGECGTVNPTTNRCCATCGAPLGTEAALPKKTHADDKSSSQAHAVELPLNKRDDGMYLGQFDDDPSILRKHDLYLECKGLNEATLRERVPKLLKCASWQQIGFILNASNPGVQCDVVPPPPALPDLQPGTVFLRMQKEGEYWDDILGSSTIALYQPIEPQDVCIRLFAVGQATLRHPDVSGCDDVATIEMF